MPKSLKCAAIWHIFCFIYSFLFSMRDTFLLDFYYWPVLFLTCMWPSIAKGNTKPLTGSKRHIHPKLSWWLEDCEGHQVSSTDCQCSIGTRYITDFYHWQMFTGCSKIITQSGVHERYRSLPGLAYNFFKVTDGSFSVWVLENDSSNVLNKVFYL